LANAYVAPRDETEQTITAIWQELLGLDQIGIYDNFFELGGHSLLAIQIVSRMRAALQVEVGVHTLFEAPTVAQLAQTLSTRDAAMPEAHKLAELLDVVERMSDGEVNAILAQSES
jgi:hypothetical protein